MVRAQSCISVVVMKKLGFCLFLIILVQLMGFAPAEAAGRQCDIYFDGPAPKLNSKNYIQSLDISAKVETMSGVLVGKSLSEALSKPEVREIISQNRRSFEILLTAKLPAREGGGLLRLVVLNESQSNLAYNHVELTTLLKVNPELANEIGFYSVDGEPGVVWAPDVKTVNFRLKRLAKKFGYSDGVWGYEAAVGVVDTMPYLTLLSKGKFPFSGNSDVNLSVHDSMHAIAFAIMNITTGSREVLEAAKSRTRIVLKIHERLVNEIGTYYSNKFLSQISTYLSSDAMERTMLLSILMTGNYDYFSASRVRSNIRPRLFTKQNRETTIERISELLRLYNYSHKTFEQALNDLAPPSDENHEKIKKIFVKEITTLKSATPAQIKSAARKIIKFMPNEMFDENAAAGSTRNSLIENHDPAGPETLRRN